MQDVKLDPQLLLELTREEISIDELLDKMDERDAFGAVTKEDVFRSWKKGQVRRAMKALKDDDGFPLIFSIVWVDRDGRTVRRYKQEALFTMGNYLQAIEYCSRNRLYWGRMEKKLRANAERKFGKQLEMFARN